MNDCECNILEGGYCERHKCQKPAHWVELCRTKENYWRAWEEGTGPGQGDRKKKPPKGKVRPPGESGCKGCGGKLAKTAWDLAKSLAAFVADGFKTVDTDEYKRRLSVCDVCEHRKGQRCSVCGCFVAVKAKGRAWDCPDGRWEQEEK